MHGKAIKDDSIRFFNEKSSFDFFCNQKGYGFGFENKTWIDQGDWKVKCGESEFQRKDLQFLGSDISAGFDDLGRYRSAKLRWRGRIEVTLTFKVYEDSYIVALIKVDNLEPEKHVDIDFPMFISPNKFGYGLYLSAIASGGEAIWPIIQIFKPKNALKKFSTSFDDGTEFLPLWIYDKARSLVILPMDHFVDYRIVNIKNGDAYGFSMRLSGLNKQKSIEAKTLLYYSDEGPSETLIKAGEVLKKIYGRTSVKRDAYPNKYLGYSTANGSFYFNRFDEKTILDVIKHLKDNAIPVRWMQLDLQWYKSPINPKVLRAILELYRGKFPSDLTEGLDPQEVKKVWWKFVHAVAGIKELMPDKEIFPNEFENIDMPIGVWIWTTRFSNETPYIQKYNWNVADSLPASKEFWFDIARNFKDRNIVWVETDNLSDIFGRKSLEGIGEKEKWLVDVFEGFGEYDIPVQMCMSPSILYPVALKTKNVYFIRTGFDFRMAPDLSEIYQNFYNSVLAWAFELYPCFDVFFTSDASYAQCDKMKTEDWALPVSYVKLSDANVIARALAHALSCGIIYIGDGIGFADKKMIMRLCLSDGELIRPDRPAIPIRNCYYVDPIKESYPLIVYTILKDYVLVGVFNLSEEKEEYSVLLEDLGAKGTYHSFEYFSREVKFLADEISDGIQPKKAKLYILCPSQGDFAVIGDIEKFLAPFVIESVRNTNDTLIANVDVVDPIKLGIICREKVNEVTVNGSLWKKWKYKNNLLEISLGHGKHLVQVRLSDSLAQQPNKKPN